MNLSPASINTRRRYLYRPPPRNHPIFSRCVREAIVQPTPDECDCRSLFLPVRDQGQEGACSGFSTAALREYIVAKLHGLPAAQYLSPAYLYARTRMVEGAFPADAGATIADELNTLENYGVCPEVDLPYNQDPTEAPTPQDDVQAVPFRSGPPILVNHADPSFLESKLAQGMPIVFGMPVYESFENTGSDGLVALPNTTTEECLGGHAMLAVGYHRPAGRLIVRNSWGLGWGDNGICYLPYALVASFFESWTIPLLS